MASFASYPPEAGPCVSLQSLSYTSAQPSTRHLADDFQAGVQVEGDGGLDCDCSGQQQLQGQQDARMPAMGCVHDEMHGDLRVGGCSIRDDDLVVKAGQGRVDVLPGLLEDPVELLRATACGAHEQVVVKDDVLGKQACWMCDGAVLTRARLPSTSFSC